MRRKNTWCLAVIIGIFCLMLNCAAAEVRINEAAPRTPEFVEIYNPDNEMLNLSEWKIRDISTDYPDNITCWTIENCSLITNLNYFIILGRNTNILEITSQPVAYFYVDDSAIGNGLTDSGDNITFFNSTFATSFNYNSSEANMSWQFCDNSWQSYSPTPGSANLCASQNSSENQSPQGTSSQPAAVNLSVDYDDEVESEEFNVSVMLYNLKNIKYDIKVYITFEENDTIISQTFDGSWKSSTYYIADAVEGPGSETSEIKMKIKDDYSNFEGDAKINVRIRESETENSVASFEGSITIKKSEVSNRTSSNQGTVSLNLVRDNSSDRGITSNVIKLNSETTNITKDIKSNIYKSKVEYFKQYGIYAFAIVCVAVIFVLLKKKKE